MKNYMAQLYGSVIWLSYMAQLYGNYTLNDLTILSFLFAMALFIDTAYSYGRHFLLLGLCYSCTILARFLCDSCAILARFLHDSCMIHTREAEQPHRERQTFLGHLKSDYRMQENYLHGKPSSTINAMLAATAWNLMKLMRKLKFLCAHFWQNTIYQLQQPMLLFVKIK